MFLQYIPLSFFIASLIHQSYEVQIGRRPVIPPEEEEFQIITDVSKNISLPCWPKSFPNKSATVYWEKNGKRRNGEKVMPDGSLFISNLSRSDTKLYICRMDENDHILTKVRLYVRGPPAPPTNVSVSVTTLKTVLMWHQPIDSDWQKEMSLIPTFIDLRYRQLPSGPWKQVPNPLDVSQKFYCIPNLSPNFTYEFQIFSYNEYGKSRNVSVFASINQNLNDTELSYRMLQSSKFTSPRVWLMSAVIVLIVINVSGTIVLIVHAKKNNRLFTHRTEDSEQIELVPNIIENPSYSSDSNTHQASTFALIQHSDFV